MGENILIDELLFIAENKESGKRIEFSLDDLDDDWNIEYENYQEREAVKNIWVGQSDYIFRLKRKDEDETDLIRPMSIVAAELYEEYMMQVEFANSELIKLNLENWVIQMRKIGFNIDLSDFIIDRSQIKFADHVRLTYYMMKSGTIFWWYWEVWGW